MIIRQFDLKRIASIPPKTDTLLIFDSNATLPGSIATQQLQQVPRRDTQIIQILRPMQDAKPPQWRLGNQKSLILI